MKKSSISKKILTVVLSVSLMLAGVLLYVGYSANVKAAETTDTSKEVLHVKVQVSSDNKIMRFISSVDSLDYSAVGFEVTPEGETTPKKYETTTVYERIASTTESVTYEFGPKVVDTDSEYFVTAKMNVAADTDYTVRAYVVSLDGQTKTYGMSRCVAVEDAATDTDLNLSFASTATVAAGTTLTATYGAESTETTATVIGSDGATVHVRVDVDKEALPSATLFTFTGAASGNTIYRNLYTKYDGSNADSTWYSVYAAAGDAEFVIATNADMYGFASVVENTDQLQNKTVYLAADMKLNEGRPVRKSDNTVTWVSESTPYNWNPIGTNNEKLFKGTFDGQGYTIEGLYCVDDGNVAGLFEHAETTSTIKNFRLENGYVYAATGYAGSVAGKSSGVISDVYSDVVVQTAVSGGTNRAGGIVGEFIMWATTGGVYRCWFDGAVLSPKYHNGGIVGYLASQIANATFTAEDCSVTGLVTGYSHTGGIIGISAKDAHYATFTVNLNNCLSAGTYVTSTNATCGTLIGGIQNQTTNMATSYSTNDCGSNFVQLYNEQGTAATEVDTAKNSGTNLPWRMSISGTNASTILGLNGTETAWKITDGVPELKQFSESTLDIEWYTKDPAVTEFTISTASELYSLVFLAQTNNFAGKTIKLANDIVLNEGDAEEWKNGNTMGLRRWWSIGDNDAAKQFKGTFDGQGHTISGLYGNYSVICRGMFGTIGQGGAVKNLRLVNSYLTSSTGYLGAIAGRSDGGKFAKIYSDAYVVASGPWNVSSPMYIGGLVGTAIATRDGVNDVLFSECWYNGSLESKSMRNGGIVGGINDYPQNGADVTLLEDCMFTGSVWTSNGKHTNGYGTAGLVGCMTTSHPLTLKNCIATDDVVCTSNQFGGALYGAAASYSVTNTTFDNCYVIGSDVVPFSMGVHSAFTGSVNGSANVVENLSDAAAMATASSAWTLVGGVPVLTVFKDITP